ncbi:DUF362 domain-containing protein [Candidatus Bathyarchaeota archaeon]|nr:DUF362 domain-containing protein [Candidatus Bathyarchaeota archaeon]
MSRGRSPVWFMDARARSSADSLENKAKRLFDEAGLAKCFDPGNRVAIKIHWGEMWNTSYLRPNLVRAIVDRIKDCGGEPFVTEGTSLGYMSARGTGYDYLSTAAAHGYTAETMGCPVIMTDGWMGTDDVEVLVSRGKMLKKTFVAKPIARADAAIIVSHWKGHTQGGFGGAIKNLGVGCVSKRGKYLLHAGADFEETPTVNAALCAGKSCGFSDYCQSICYTGAIRISDKGLEYDPDKCIYCSAGCICASLGKKAVDRPQKVVNGLVYQERVQTRFTDNALAVVNTVGKDRVGFINYMIDVTPACDCATSSDTPMIQNIGVFASMDPLAIDQACYDAMVKATGLPDSRAEGMGPGVDKLTKIHGFDVTVQLKVGEEIELGNRGYDLNTLDSLTNESMTAIWPWKNRASIYQRFVEVDHPLKPLLPESHPIRIRFDERAKKMAKGKD